MPEAGNERELARFAQDELRYAGTETAVGLAPDNDDVVTELLNAGLLQPPGPGGARLLWRLTDGGIDVGRLITALEHAPPDIQAAVSGLLPRTVRTRDFWVRLVERANVRPRGVGAF